MISDEYFRSDTPLGVTKKYRHIECTPEHKAPALNVTRIDDGWIWYCFRCRKGGKKFISSLSPAQYKQWIKNKSIQPDLKVRTVKLPNDFSLILPSKGKVWFYKYGITDKEIKEYGMGYSKYYDRIILPVYNKDKLLFWLGRNLGLVTRENPKYRTVQNYKRKDLYFKIGSTNSNKVCIVEDIISAIKVGRQVPCYALLSAHVPDRLIKNLLDKYGKSITLYLWLDYDKQDKMIQWLQRYKSLFNINIKIVVTIKDPKCYSNKEIKEFINE